VGGCAAAAQGATRSGVARARYGGGALEARGWGWGRWSVRRGGTGGHGRLGVDTAGHGWSVVAGPGLAMAGLRPWLSVGDRGSSWPCLAARGC
jgi:hypothetical protein